MAEGRELVRRAGRSPVRRKKGAIERLRTASPAGSVEVDLDEMGPESAKSFRGQKLVQTEPRQTPDGPPKPAERAGQEIDYGRRGKGYSFGAFLPSSGEALTHPYPGRSAANWADFLERVDAWIPAEIGLV
jgi:hypothetical protein